MRIQEAIVRQLQQTTSATYAITGTRIFWSITATDPTLPFVRIRKSGHAPQMVGISTQRLPAEASIEVVCYAKTQAGAADLADAVNADLMAISGTLPNTSPATSGAVWVSGVTPGTEEDLVSEDAFAKGIFAEMREYAIIYR